MLAGGFLVFRVTLTRPLSQVVPPGTRPFLFSRRFQVLATIHHAIATRPPHQLIIVCPDLSRFTVPGSRVAVLSGLVKVASLRLDPYNAPSLEKPVIYS
jgi:hypothetical protein